MEEDVIHMVKSTYETVVPVHDLHLLAGEKMGIFSRLVPGGFRGAVRGRTGGSAAF